MENAASSKVSSVMKVTASQNNNRCFPTIFSAAPKTKRRGIGLFNKKGFKGFQMKRNFLNGVLNLLSFGGSSADKDQDQDCVGIMTNDIRPTGIEPRPLIPIIRNRPSLNVSNNYLTIYLKFKFDLST